MTELLAIELGEEELGQEATKFAELLSQEGPFCLWLEGEMGAGKSTLTRQILWALGLSRNVPVVSPTYTIMNEYRISEKWYAHLDLYRAEDNFSLDELGVRDIHEFSGLFVEWPEVPGEQETLVPTHKVTITMVREDRRHYRLERL